MNNQTIRIEVAKWLKNPEECTVPISEWDVSSVTDMSELFKDATSFNGDLSYWDVSSVIHMGDMFLGATSFNGVLSNWDISSLNKESQQYIQKIRSRFYLKIFYGYLRAIIALKRHSLKAREVIYAPGGTGFEKSERHFKKARLS